jgi:hypothetical protein
MSRNRNARALARRAKKVEPPTDERRPRPFYELYHARLIDNLTYQKDFRAWICGRAFVQEFLDGGAAPIGDLPCVLVHEEGMRCCLTEHWEKTLERVLFAPLVDDDLVFGSKPKSVHVPGF